MAKDDMPVLFCKILIYLYKVLKGKQERDEYYIQPMTKDFPISETYLQAVLIELQEKGYIRNLRYKTAFGGDVVYFNYNNIGITYDGVEFLRENSTMRKMAQTLKEAIPILELFN
jgi:hypothetical protein